MPVMQSRSILAFCLLSHVLGCAAVHAASGFLQTRGQDIVDTNGQKVLLRGVGLGNWLLPEGYMWKFGSNGDRPRKIEKLIAELVGEEKAEQFWQTFRRNYITEADIQRIAELGFNSVRPALNARLFMAEGGNPTMIEKNFELLDNLVEWCRTHNVFIIIDMHGAPGGQSRLFTADPDGGARLWTSGDHQERTVELWQILAERYFYEQDGAQVINRQISIKQG